MMKVFQNIILPAEVFLQSSLYMSMIMRDCVESLCYIQENRDTFSISFQAVHRLNNTELPKYVLRNFLIFIRWLDLS